MSSLTRGPRSARAREAALPVAWRRGEVMALEQGAGSCFDFMTGGPAGPVAVRADRALRIHGTLAEIALAHAGAIDRMNAASILPGITRELWLWAPWGTMRYFRIDGTTITELDMLGNVRMPLMKGSLAGKYRPQRKTSRKKSDMNIPAPAPGSTQLAATTPASGNVREPAPVRYLRHRAAELARKKEEEERATAKAGATDKPAGVSSSDTIPVAGTTSPSEGTLPEEV